MSFTEKSTVKSRLLAAGSAVRAFTYAHASVAAAILAPRRALTLATIRVSRRGLRGAGMLEYALIALISIAIFLAIRGPLVEFFQGLTERIDTEINEDGETPLD